MSSTSSLTDGVTVLVDHEKKESAKVDALRAQLDAKRIERQKKNEEEKKAKEVVLKKSATEELHQFSTETLAEILRTEETKREAELATIAKTSPKKKDLVTQSVTSITNGSLFR